MNPSPPACDFCGRAEAHELAGQFICDDCYIAKGSCCATDDEGEEVSVTTTLSVMACVNHQSPIPCPP